MQWTEDEEDIGVHHKLYIHIPLSDHQSQQPQCSRLMNYNGNEEEEEKRGFYTNITINSPHHEIVLGGAPSVANKFQEPQLIIIPKYSHLNKI